MDYSALLIYLAFAAVVVGGSICLLARLVRAIREWWQYRRWMRELMKVPPDDA